MVRHWLRHTPTYRSFDLRSTQSALTSSILMRFFPSHPTPFGCLYIRYNLLDLIDRISYTIKTKFLNFFIPMLPIIKIATIWRRNTASNNIRQQTIHSILRHAIQDFCHPEYQFSANNAFRKKIALLFSLAV